MRAPTKLEVQPANGMTVTPLLEATALRGMGSHTLAGDVSNYDLICFEISNGNEWKPYMFTKASLGAVLDVSWNATDSTAWYIICTISLSGTSLSIHKFSRGGFTASNMRLFGVKLN